MIMGERKKGFIIPSFATKKGVMKGSDYIIYKWHLKSQWDMSWSFVIHREAEHPKWDPIKMDKHLEITQTWLKLPRLNTRSEITRVHILITLKLYKYIEIIWKIIWINHFIVFSNSDAWSTHKQVGTWNITLPTALIIGNLKVPEVFGHLFLKGIPPKS